MSEYKYENPLDKGYKQFTLTRKQHNELFQNRKIRWYEKYEYYYNDDLILLHKFYNWYVVILQTILFPIIILFEGLANIKEIWLDLKTLYNQKKYGRFSGDDIWRNSKKYQETMKIIKSKSHQK